MKKIILISIFVVVSLLGNSARAALLKAEGTMTLNSISPSINLETVNALSAVFPSEIAFQYIFDVDESVADIDADPSKGLFPLSIINLQLSFGAYDFAISSNPCPNPTIDCRVATFQSFGSTSVLVFSQIATSETLANDLFGLTSLIPSPFFDPSVSASFSLSQSLTSDPNVFPDLRNSVGGAGLSLFMSSPFGSSTTTENRVNFTSANVIVSDYEPVNSVYAPNNQFFIALALMLLIFHFRHSFNGG